MNTSFVAGIGCGFLLDGLLELARLLNGVTPVEDILAGVVLIILALAVRYLP